MDSWLQIFYTVSASYCATMSAAMKYADSIVKNYPRLRAHQFVASMFAMGAISVCTAQSDSIDEIVVTGTHLPANTNDLSKSVTVLSDNYIQQRNSNGLIDLLSNFEGIHVIQPGGPSGTASLFLRGAEPNFTTVLVDGVKVNNPNNTRGGSINFASISDLEIERVEIIRGPQSAIYGSDALAGVINLISRKADSNSATVRREIGEQGFSESTLRGSLKLNDEHNLSGGLSETDSGSTNPGGAIELDSAWAALAGSFNNDATHYRINIRESEADAELFTDDSGGYLYAVNRELEQSNFADENASVFISHNWNSNWTSQFLASRYSRDDHIKSPGVFPGVRNGVPPTDFDSNLTRRFYQFSTAYRNDGFSFSFGADRQEEEGTLRGSVELGPGFSLPADYNIDRDITGLYVDTGVDLNENWTLLASLRFDSPDNSDDQWSPGIGLLGNLNEGRTKIRVNVTQGFKLPSFFALASPLTGNPDLVEEKVEGWDIGITQTINNRTSVQATYFDSEYEDLVDFDSEAFTTVNRSRVDVNGIELALNYGLDSGLILRDHATYTDVDVLPEGKLRNRPNWRGGIQLTQNRSETFSWFADFQYIDDSFDSSIPIGDATLDSYTKLNIGASWRASNIMTLRAVVDNVFDEEYEEAIGFVSIGRLARITLELTL